MSGQYFGNAADFLIRTVFEIYLLLIMLRFLMQWARADFYNPLCQFFVMVTDPPLRPLRRVIPTVARFDIPSLVLMFVLAFAEHWLLFFIHGVFGGPVGLSVLVLAELLALLLNIFFWAIFIQVVISWVNPGLNNPVTALLYSLNEPLLAPVRRLLPPMRGLDFSPLVVILAVQLLQILVVAPVRDLARPLL